MKQTIPGKFAAALSIGAVLGYVIYSMVINAANLASEPWYRSPLFSIGGSLFALAALISGSMAFHVGRAHFLRAKGSSLESALLQVSVISLNRADVFKSMSSPRRTISGLTQHCTDLAA
jgi:hypothetical protein